MKIIVFDKKSMFFLNFLRPSMCQRLTRRGLRASATARPAHMAASRIFSSLSCDSLFTTF